jgi:hypothetical protein
MILFTKIQNDSDCGQGLSAGFSSTLRPSTRIDQGHRTLGSLAIARVEVEADLSAFESKEDIVKFRCRYLSVIGIASLALAISEIALAQNEITHSVRMIVPCPAGSSVDVVARNIARRITEKSGQQINVENVPAGTSSFMNIDSEALLDGYTTFLNAPVCESDDW